MVYKDQMNTFDKIEKLLFQKNTDNSKIILDLWSWTWRISEAIQHKNKNIIAIDYSPQALSCFKEKNYKYRLKSCRHYKTITFSRSFFWYHSKLSSFTTFSFRWFGKYITGDQ